MQVLYRKYRPKTFEEVEGQEHVVRTLQGALISGRVGHAYLFCGPRGTGKTTMARLLAKSLNCANFSKVSERNVGEKLSIRRSLASPSKTTGEGRGEGGYFEPCNSCHSCSEINEGRSLDLIEIDAASNRGIDEIRNLKESARVAATGGQYKVFIVDECHMLTKEANNALLKLLEEPPSHVIFILATTESHKLLDTILSRVQRFDFKKIATDKIQSRLITIAQKEEIKTDPEALAILASFAGGSLRDAESAFNKVIAYAGQGAEISSGVVAEILGIVPMQVHETLSSLILSKKPQEAINQINDLHESGVDLNNFLKQFIGYLRNKLIGLIGDRPYVVSVAVSSNQATPEFLIKSINVFMKASSEIKLSPIQQLPIELAILELTK
ncbi:MAG: DNA polymerase III subunit gamma/tau [Patescibacteria group bacterium]